jgi:AcrR family transcriptional regulator
MPKKLENMKETILDDARKILKNDSYDTLTIRRVAADCQIAVGTVYNYFPSKEILAASIMLEDWQKTLAEIQKKTAKTDSLSKAMKITYQQILSFAQFYRGSWRTYTFTQEETLAFKSRHRKLVQQIAGCLAPFTAEQKKEISAHYDIYLAENILACINGSSLKIDELIQIIEKGDSTNGRR